MSHKPLGITDVVLRDASQSLLATRVRLDDMLPIAEKLDQVGFAVRTFSATGTTPTTLSTSSSSAPPPTVSTCSGSSTP